MNQIKKLDGELIGDLWTSSDLWENLQYLCDDCQGRFAGTADEKRAGDYLMNRMQTYGLMNVTAEPFEMRGWERGETSFTLIDQAQEVELPCLALPGTQGCRIEAEIVDAGDGSQTDYQRLGQQVQGKIVLTSASGPSRSEKYMNAIEAGASAFIFSGGHPGLLIPTGSIDKELPGIGLASEHTARLRRYLSKGPVRGRLSIDAKAHPVTARNIVAEIPGRQTDEGWILVGAHYDGHDIAQGAQDNATGTAVLVEAARLLAPLQSLLDIGIRFVLFSGEELGLFGSYAYARDHSDEYDRIRVIFNADIVGMGMPLVLQTQASPELAAYFRSLPLDDLDAVVKDDPKAFIMNSDHFPFSLAGIQAVWAVTSHPASGFGWGHTMADTLDKLDLRILRQTAACVARLLLRMATDPEKLPRGRKSPEEVQKLVTEAGFEKSLRASGKWPF